MQASFACRSLVDISQALLYRVALAVTLDMLDDNAARFFTVAMAPIPSATSHSPSFIDDSASSFFAGDWPNVCHSG